MFEQDFLKARNAAIDDQGNIRFTGFDIKTDPCPDTFITIIPGFTLLHVGGSDAESFLHGQLTADVEKLADGAGSTAAWCNPRGRVITTFLIYRLDGEFFLLLPSVLRDYVVKRLTMFVLRADVQIADFTESRSILGVRGQSENDNTFGITKLNDRLHLFLPDSRSERCLIVDETHTLQDVWSELAQSFQPVDSRCWQLLDIRAGIPWLNNDTSEQFLPQELNLEDTGGLSFSKGCYPGQEVVARVHYRGQVKRRLYQATSNSNTGIIAGMKIRDDNGKSTGTIINSAPDAEHIELMAVIDTSNDISNTLYLESNEALPIEILRDSK